MGQDQQVEMKPPRFYEHAILSCMCTGTDVVVGVTETDTFTPNIFFNEKSSHNLVHAKRLS